MLPNFLVIGAPRCGTTWIEKNLRLHPDVFLPKKKELHFFDENYDKGMTYYESCFSGWSGQKAVGEATPDYLHGAYARHDIAALINRHLPDVKLIASLRNPVERAYSRFWHAKARFAHNRDFSFEEKLKDRPQFIAEGFYAEQLQHYYSLFPRESILVLLYDDILAAPGAFMRRIYAFLGVDAAFESGIESVNFNAAAGKGNLAKSPWLWQLSRALVKAGAYGIANRIRLANSIATPPMNTDIRRTLTDIYREPNLRLQELIGRDLGNWNSF